MIAALSAAVMGLTLISTPMYAAGSDPADAVNYVNAGAANATSGSCGENVTWNLDKATGTLTIGGTGNMDNYTDDYPLVSPWHNSVRSIDRVVVESGVTGVGSCAFEDCEALISAEISDSVTSIGRGAFESCSSLRSVTLPPDLQIIESSVFEGCYNLRSVEIPSGVTAIMDDAFEDTGLTEITIPKNVASIGENAFSECPFLSSVTIENPNCIISGGGFTVSNGEDHREAPYFNGTIYGYANSTAQSYAERYGYAFENLGSAPGVENPTEPVTQPGTQPATQPVTEPVTVPDTEKPSDDSVSGFCGAYGSEQDVSWTLDKGTGILTLSGSGSMQNYFDDDTMTAPWYSYNHVIRQVIVENGVTNIGDRAFEDCRILSSVEISDSVTGIGAGAFEDCNALASVTIPDSVLSIGKNAFEHCHSLTAIKLPPDLSVIDSGVFEGCYNLKSVDISSGVTVIRNEAFEDAGFTEITIPANVGSIGLKAFSECPYLEKITIENPDCEIYNSWFTISNGEDIHENPYFSGTICGYDNSTAQEYAGIYGYNFESLGSAPNVEDPTEPVTDPVTEPDTVPATEPPTEEPTEDISDDSGDYDTITWSVGSGEVIQGEKITVDVRVIADPGDYLPIAGASFQLPQFDGLKLVSVSGSEAYSSTVTYNLDLGLCKFSTYDGYGVSAENNSIAFTVTYEAGESCVPGEYAVDLSDILITDENGNDISGYLQVTGGNITVLPYGEETTAEITQPPAEETTVEGTTDEAQPVPGPQDDGSWLNEDGSVFSADEIEDSVIKPQLSLSNVEIGNEGASGRIIEISLNIYGAEKCWSHTSTHIYYDPRLTPATDDTGNIDYTPGSAADGLGSLETVIESLGVISLRTTSTADHGGTGTIVTYKFILPESAKAGDVYSVYIGYETGDIFTNMAKDRLMHAYALSNSIAGGITVAGSQPQVTTPATTAEPETTTTTAVDTTQVPQATTTSAEKNVPATTTAKVTTKSVTTTSPSTTASEPVSDDLGDVDRSGSIDSSDASIVLQEYALLATGQSGKLTAEQTRSADVNSDGSVDSSDASTILSYYAYTATGGRDPFDLFIES